MHLSLNNSFCPPKYAIFKGGNIWNKEILEIDGQNVTYIRRKFSFCDTFYTSIPITNIVSVDIFNGLTGSSITIRSFGSIYIEAKGFTTSNAKQIRRLLIQ